MYPSGAQNLAVLSLEPEIMHSSPAKLPTVTQRTSFEWPGREHRNLYGLVLILLQNYDIQPN